MNNSGMIVKDFTPNLWYPHMMNIFKTLVFLCLGFVIGQSPLLAQNDLACINDINFSLDPTTCTGFLTAEQALVGNEMCATGFEIIITDEFNREVPNSFTADDVGETFTYMICCDDNCCWGTINVEFKAALGVLCPPDDTIPCGTLDFYSFFTPPATACGEVNVSLISQEKTHKNCELGITATVERTYRVTDNFGNSRQCQQTISLERLNPNDVFFPEDLEVSCSDPTLVFDENGIPFPFFFQPMGTGMSTGSGTGSGTAAPPQIIAGLPTVCGITAPFDHFFGSNSGDNPYGVTAGLGGNDPISGSSFFCPRTGSGTSGAFPLIPPGGAVLIVETGDPNNPEIITKFVEGDNIGQLCNTQLTFTDLIFPPFNGGCKRQIARTWELREWFCTTESVTTSVQFIEIIDDVAPEFVCPSDLTVSSNDGCGANFNLPKVNPVDLCGQDITVTAQTPFGLVEGDGARVSLDLGKNVIQLTVADGCLNRSTCSFTVTIEDKLEPVAICDASKVVSLSTLDENKVLASVFDNGSFDDCGIDRFEVRRMVPSCDTSATEFGPYVEFCCDDVLQDEVMVVFRVLDKSGNQSICMVRVEVQNKLVPNLTCPADMTIDCSQGYDINNLGLTFGVPNFSGNCGGIQIPEEVVNADVNQCGVGTLERIFKLRDGQGNVVRSCTQNLTVENTAPFNVTNITFPLDFEQNNGCGVEMLAPGLLPDAFGFPTIFSSTGCELIGFDYVDRVFEENIGSGACLVIERTWTVVNWCSTIGGEFEVFISPQPQMLRLRNTSPPVLDNNMAITYDAHGSDCVSGQILVTRSAIDDCVNGLIWEYTVRDANGAIVTAGFEPTFSGSFPVGRYEVEWTVSDGCGNSDSDIQVLDVFDGTPPTPVCHNGLAIALVGDDTDGDGLVDFDSVELWARDIDAGSVPNCSNPITFSFSSDTTDRFRIFDCSNLGLQEVDLWVTDVLTGAQDFCRGLVDIQGGTTCLTGNIVAIEGEVFTETFQMIEGVNVNLETNVGVDVTDSEGVYAFDDMVLGGDYQVIPEFDENYLNGVSTIDIIMIQRHILGIETLDSPYKLIAADVDNNERINGVDLVELRKLILGIYTELPQNESWRFVFADHIFAQPTNPWSSRIPEWFNIIDLSQDMELDFIGVKIGDVNEDVVMNFANSQEQSSATLNFNTKVSPMRMGEVQTIPIYASNYKEIRGWQTTFSYNAEQVEVLTVLPGALDVKQENFFRGEPGMMSFSFDGAPQSVGSEDILFEVQIYAKSDIETEVFEVTSDLTNSEAYNKDFERWNLGMNELEPLTAEILSLYPNPFVKEAQLKFFLPEKGEVRFEFYDMDGKVLDIIEGDYDKGVSQLQLSRSSFETTGVVYLRMLSSGDITEHRMIVL